MLTGFFRVYLFFHLQDSPAYIINNVFIISSFLMNSLATITFTTLENREKQILPFERPEPILAHFIFFIELLICFLVIWSEAVQHIFLNALYAVSAKKKKKSLRSWELLSLLLNIYCYRSIWCGSGRNAYSCCGWSCSQTSLLTLWHIIWCFDRHYGNKQLNAGIFSKIRDFFGFFGGIWDNVSN